MARPSRTNGTFRLQIPVAPTIVDPYCPRREVTIHDRLPARPKPTKGCFSPWWAGSFAYRVRLPPAGGGDRTRSARARNADERRLLVRAAGRSRASGQPRHAKADIAGTRQVPLAAGSGSGGRVRLARQGAGYAAESGSGGGVRLGRQRAAYAAGSGRRARGVDGASGRLAPGGIPRVPPARARSTQRRSPVRPAPSPAAVTAPG